MRKFSTLRRAAGALGVALGLLAVTGPGATAASLQDILSGQAGSTALKITLDLPSVEQLRATLKAVGLPATDSLAVLDSLQIPTHIEQVLSMTHGTVVRADENLPDGAEGFAASGTGTLELLNNSVTTSCKAVACGDASKTVSGQRVNLPLGLGFVDLARASSETVSNVKTLNEADVAKVKIDLGGLIDEGKPLAALGDILAGLTATVNDAVLPTVNEALLDINDTLRGILTDDLEDIIFEDGAGDDGLITNLGNENGIKPIPDLRDVDLLNLRVIGADSKIGPYSHDGVDGLRASSTAGVADLDIFGNWTTADALTVESLAQANGTKAGTKASSDVKMVGADIGEALGLAIDFDDIEFLVNPTKLQEKIEKQLVSLGVPADTAATVSIELANAADLLYSIAGISVEAPSKFAQVDGSGAYAWAKAGAESMVLTVAPQVPKIEALTNNLPVLQDGGGIVPVLDDDDFVATGIVLKIEFPRGDARVSIGDVQDKVFRPTGRTGVGATPWLYPVALFGIAAVVVRRLVMSK